MKKRSRKAVCGVLLAMALSACGQEPTGEFTGTLSDVQLNTLTVLSEEGRPMDFVVDDATLELCDELVAGCPVKIVYRGKLKEGACTVVSLETNPVYARLVGRWIETGEESAGFGMGIELLPGGVAHSIGMQTLVFSSWELTPQGGLLLAGRSIGNGTTIAFEEEWEIVDLGPSQLTISQDDLTFRFRREMNEDIEARENHEAEMAQPKQ